MRPSRRELRHDTARRRVALTALRPHIVVQLLVVPPPPPASDALHGAPYPRGTRAAVVVYGARTSGLTSTGATGWPLSSSSSGRGPERTASLARSSRAPRCPRRGAAPRALVIQRLMLAEQRYGAVTEQHDGSTSTGATSSRTTFTDRRRGKTRSAPGPTRSSPAIARTPSVKVSARLVRLQASTAASDVRRRNGAEMPRRPRMAFGALDHYNAQNCARRP